MAIPKGAPMTQILGKALITGGAGFIGSTLVRAATRIYGGVVVVDDLSHGRDQNLPPGTQISRTDIRARDAVFDIFRKERPEVVFHLAAQVSVSRSTKDPSYDASINILGGLNILDACQEFGVRRLVYTSSGGAAYGEPAILPCPEDHPIRPLSGYGVSKYTFELYLHSYSRASGLSYAVLRLANVYGPRQRADMEGGVVAIFANQMLGGEETIIFGQGDQIRDFVYVEDVADAAIRSAAMTHNVTVNIGTGMGTTVSELHAELAALVGYARPPRYAPPRAGDVHKSILSVQKAKDELHWSASWPLRKGLEQTVADLRDGQGRLRDAIRP